MADEEVKLISIELVVGDETVAALYEDPVKIAGMLAEEKSLGGFLRELRDMKSDEEGVTEVDPPPMARTMTARDVALVDAFEALVEKEALTPVEVRTLICGIVAGFADGASINIDELHEEIDAAYAYRIAHPPGRPS